MQLQKSNPKLKVNPDLPSSKRKTGSDASPTTEYYGTSPKADASPTYSLTPKSASQWKPTQSAFLWESQSSSKPQHQKRKAHPTADSTSDSTSNKKPAPSVFFPTAVPPPYSSSQPTAAPYNALFPQRFTFGALSSPNPTLPSPTSSVSSSKLPTPQAPAPAELPSPVMAFQTLPSPNKRNPPFLHPAAASLTPTSIDWYIVNNQQH